MFLRRGGTDFQRVENGLLSTVPPPPSKENPELCKPIEFLFSNLNLNKPVSGGGGGWVNYVKNKIDG